MPKDPITKLRQEIKLHEINLHYHESELQDLKYLIEIKKAKLIAMEKYLLDADKPCYTDKS